MWRHVHDTFEAEGANAYVIWVWAPNIVNNLPDFGQSTWYMKSLYPGDDYVDWTGLSGYLRQPFRKGNDASFSFVYDRTLDRLREITHKPILLAEVGATEVGGLKPYWVRTFFEAFAKPENSDLIGFAWFNLTVTTVLTGDRVTNDWRIDSRRDTLDQFRRGIDNPAAGFGGTGKIYAAIPPAPVTLPAPPATPTPTPTPTPGATP